MWAKKLEKKKNPQNIWQYNLHKSPPGLRLETICLFVPPGSLPAHVCCSVLVTTCRTTTPSAIYYLPCRSTEVHWPNYTRRTVVIIFQQDSTRSGVSMCDPGFSPCSHPFCFSSPLTLPLLYNRAAMLVSSSLLFFVWAFTLFMMHISNFNFIQAAPRFILLFKKKSPLLFFNWITYGSLLRGINLLCIAYDRQGSIVT